MLKKYIPLSILKIVYATMTLPLLQESKNDVIKYTCFKTWLSLYMSLHQMK